MIEVSEGKRNCKTIDSLDEQRDCLRENLLKAQEALNTTESDISASEKQITAIEALISKRDQIIVDYVKAYPGLKARYDEFKAIYNNEKNSLENLLTSQGKQRVVEIVNNACNRVKALNDKLNKSNESLNGEISKGKEGKRKELDVKKQALEDAKKIYDQWIDLVKSIESRFKSLEKIKTEIDKEQSVSNYRYAYYLLELTEKDSFKFYLDGLLPMVIDPNGINNKLIEVWRNYQEKDEAFQRTTGEVKALEKGIETSKKQLIEDEKNLEATIKRLLNSEIKDEGNSGGGGSGGSGSGSTPDSSGKKQYGNTSADAVPKVSGPHQSGASNQNVK